MFFFGILGKISRHLQYLSRWRPIAYKPHIECKARHDLQGSPHSGADPVRTIAEGAPTKLREQN